MNSWYKNGNFGRILSFVCMFGLIISPISAFAAPICNQQAVQHQQVIQHAQPVVVNKAQVVNHVANHIDNPVVVQQRVVQFDNNTYLGLNGYFTHGENLVSQKNAENSQLIDELKEQNKALRELIERLANPAPQPAPQPVPTPNPPVSPPVSPPPPPTPAPVNPSLPKVDFTVLEQKVYDIFAANCAKCHGDTKADGGLKLVSNGKLAPLDLVSAVLTHHRVNGVNLDGANGEVRMPKGSPPLDNGKVETIRMWLVEMALSLKEGNGR